MKKLLILLVTVLITATISNAQSKLFKCFESGMSKSEFETQGKLHHDFKHQGFYLITYIKNRKYYLYPIYNKQNQLKTLMFISDDTYDWVNYDTNVKENARELYSLLEVKYGDPTHNMWINWNSIPDGKERIVCIFEKQTINAVISVGESNEQYYIILYLYDSKYKDPEVNTSGGF